MNRIGALDFILHVTCRIVLPVLALALLLSLSTVAGCAPTPSLPGLLKIIIYTDLECSACEKLHSEVEPELRARYLDTDQAQIEVRLLGVMSIDSMRAAQAALCAGDQGHFVEYQDALFRAWREDDVDAYSMDRLVALAGSLGLDAAALSSCLESGEKEAEIEKNMDLARGDDVHTLPAVVVGGAKVEGYRPLDAYTDIINLALEDD